MLAIEGVHARRVAGSSGGSFFSGSRYSAAQRNHAFVVAGTCFIRLSLNIELAVSRQSILFGSCQPSQVG